MKISSFLMIILLILVFTVSCTVREAVLSAPHREAAVNSPALSSPPSMPSPFASVSVPEPSQNAAASIGPQSSEKSVVMTKDEIVENTKALPSGSIVDVSKLDKAAISRCFFAEKISDAVFARMEGKSFGKKCTTKRADLRYVKVLYTGFDGKTHVGELVVNKKIAKDMTEIFLELYKAKYPIEKMKLVDDYNADDDASMADNNTSAFNFRTVEGSKTLSQHAYGLAIDINPLYNPYIIIKNGKKKIEPPNGKKYANRKLKCPYYIKKGDKLYKLFAKHGFSWGGNWRPAQDYQHFSKKK